MIKKKHYKIIILGSGPAGYTAAIYAARANLKPVIISGLDQGGQLMNTTDVDNWPGDSTNLQGPDLMNRMENHVKNFNVKIINDNINTTNLKEKPFYLKGEACIYTCDSLIICTGGNAKLLGLSSELKFFNKGVSTCATCDGFFFKDKIVAVVGGGDTAVEEAIYLSNIAKKVYLIHRRDKLRANKQLISNIEKKINELNGKIEIIWNSNITDIIGNEYLTNIKIKNKINEKTSSIQIDGLFIAIGHIPNTTIFRNQLETFDTGHIKINFNKDRVTETSIKGIFAAGDVTDYKYKQAITAAGYGCMAAIDAEKYLEEL